jgi:hypothetical protein
VKLEGFLGAARSGRIRRKTRYIVLEPDKFISQAEISGFTERLVNGDKNQV